MYALLFFLLCPQLSFAMLLGYGYCEEGWTYYRATDSCYITKHNAQFADAEKQCVSLGAHLTSIHSSEENVFVSNLASAGMGLNGLQLVWIGVHQLYGEWANTDGTPVDYMAWAPKEPNNSGGKEQCVELFADLPATPYFDDTYYQRWNDYTCPYSKRSFVCKKASMH